MSSKAERSADKIPLREPKGKPEKEHAMRCHGAEGYLRPSGAQDCVFCTECDSFLYNAPRVETGHAVRTVTTVHNGVSASMRAQIILRANSTCELCHFSNVPIHVGHLLSVKRGLEQGLTEAELNSDENLASMCEECNLGLGSNPVPLRLVIAIAMARMRLLSARGNEGEQLQ